MEISSLSPCPCAKAPRGRDVRYLGKDTDYHQASCLRYQPRRPQIGLKFFQHNWGRHKSTGQECAALRCCFVVLGMLLTGGALDILINNAGGGYSMPLLDAPLDEISKQFDLNALSILRVTRGFMHLLRRSQSPHGALVANNTSLVSTLPVPLQGAYSASKAAAASITECLRLELQMFGIQVIDLKTASVKTAFLDNVPSVHVPSDSHYAKQRDVVEKRLREGPEAQPITATAWAEQIVRDLSCSRPSPVIYRGGSARLGRIFASLPIGLRFKDSTIKEFSGLKEVEEAFKNRGKKDG